MRHLVTSVLVATALATIVVPAEAKPCRRLCRPLIRQCTQECVSRIGRRGPCAFGCRRTILPACRLAPQFPTSCAGETSGAE